MPLIRLHITVYNFCVKLANTLKILSSVSVILKIIRFIIFITEHGDSIFKDSIYRQHNENNSELFRFVHISQCT